MRCFTASKAVESASRKITEEYTGLRKACMSWFASPQISELKARLPASKMPTTVQSRMAKRKLSPTPPPRKRRAMLAPAMSSADPGRGSRPLISLTWGRNSSDSGWMPRMVTWEVWPLPRLGRLISTSSSLARRRRPRSPRATWGSVSTTAAC